MHFTKVSEMNRHLLHLITAESSISFRENISNTKPNFGNLSSHHRNGEAAWDIICSVLLWNIRQTGTIIICSLGTLR